MEVRMGIVGSRGLNNVGEVDAVLDSWAARRVVRGDRVGKELVLERNWCREMNAVLVK